MLIILNLIHFYLKNASIDVYNKYDAFILYYAHHSIYLLETNASVNLNDKIMLIMLKFDAYDVIFMHFIGLMYFLYYI